MIDGTTIDDAEDLDLLMPKYNLMKYSSSYSETTESLWFYFKDEPTNFNADIGNSNNLNVSHIALNYKKTLNLIEIMEKFENCFPIKIFN